MADAKLSFLKKINKIPFDFENYFLDKDITVVDFAKMLGVSRTFVYSLIHKGEIARNHLNNVQDAEQYILRG